MGASPGLIRTFQAVAGIVALLVFVQAILAGQFTYNGEDLEDVHEMVANVVFLFAAGQLVLAWLTRESWRYKMVIWCAIVLALTVAQIGLGYGGRDEPDVAAIHIPVGVLLFSLTSIVAVLAVIDERAKDALKSA